MTYATHSTAWPAARHIAPVKAADPAPSTLDQIIALMADGRERTALDVARKVGADTGRVGCRMGKMVADGLLLAEVIQGVRLYRSVSSERPREKRAAKGAQYAAAILDLLATHGPLTRPEMTDLLGLSGRAVLRYAIEMLQRQPNARICVVAVKGVGSPAYVYDLTERAQA